MKKTAVVFMLIFSLLITSVVLAGCGGNAPGTGESQGANEPGSGANMPGTGEGANEPGTDAGTNAAGSEGSGSSPGTPDEGQAAPGSSGDSSPQTSGRIPDTNESAVSDWGVAGNNAGSAPGRTDLDQVIVDRDDLFFAIREAADDDTLVYTWKVYIENRTDKNLMFSFEKVSVNGVMCDPYWAELVTAGKKGNCEVIWMLDSLAERGIDEVAQVDFTLNVYNDDDYTEAPLMHDPFTVCPLGEGQKVSAPARRQPSGSDVVLVDNDDCSIIVTGFDPDNSWGYAVQLYLMNKTEEDLIFSTENASVNGIMCEPYWAEIVTAGHAAYSGVLWDSASLSENGITEVTEISLPLRVYSDKDVLNPYVEETFELKP